MKRYLGGGTDGDVWESSHRTAVKVFKYDRAYFNERDSYLRLADFGVTREIEGFWIPQMVNHDDELLVVEMEIMQHHPYVIDFGKVRIDRPPDFSPEVLEEAEREGEERFEHNWPRVKALLAALESYQIYYLDARRGNVTFPDMP